MTNVATIRKIHENYMLYQAHGDKQNEENVQAVQVAL